MKNQYVGDIGDYGKLGLLRILQNAGFQVGVNWYLTPDDNSRDGRHIQYLDKPCDTPDIHLHQALHQLVKTGCRNISGLESPDLLPGVSFYSDMLDYNQVPVSTRRDIRDKWHGRAHEKLKACDIVFLDPDNGVEIKSKKPHHKAGNKYVTYQEAAQYYATGASVLIYNHHDRSKEEIYIERFQRFCEIPQTKNANLLCITFRKEQVRDYVFLSQERHWEKLRVTIDESIFGTPWRNYFTYRAI
ncbi:MAG TPA: hypothetical protein VN366_02240 [Feifaniaceae bacterium]|nr:hypothetical protein [Feifaniaceae bacterium]